MKTLKILGLGFGLVAGVSTASANVVEMICKNVMGATGRPHTLVIEKDAAFGWKASFYHGTSPLEKRFSYDGVLRKVSPDYYESSATFTQAGPKDNGFYLIDRIEFYQEGAEPSGAIGYHVFNPLGNGMWEDRETGETLRGTPMNPLTTVYNCKPL
jgi:hypothetical protein